MSLRRLSTFTAVVACAATAAALPAASVQAAPAAAAKASHAHVYHLSDRGRTVHVSKGERFKVSLVAATDGGYNWTFKHHPDSSIVKYIGRKNHSLTPSPQTTPPTVGAGTRDVFIFRGVGRGTTTIKLVEKRPFGHERPVKHFSLTVKVG